MDQKISLNNIFYHHKWMTVSLVRIFVPSNQQMWKRFRHIYFVQFFGWWNCLNGTNGKDINVNVKAVNIDNVFKRRQTLSLFFSGQLKRCDHIEFLWITLLLFFLANDHFFFAHLPSFYSAGCLVARNLGVKPKV